MTTPSVIEYAGAVITASRSPSVTFTAQPKTDDIVCMWPSSTSTGVTPTAPSGWVNVQGGTTDIESDSHEICCFFHVVTAAEEAAATKTYAATNLYGATTTGYVEAALVRYVDQTKLPVSNNYSGTTFSSTNTATPHVLASVQASSVTEAGALPMSSVAGDGLLTYTNPAGWTQGRQDNTNQGRWIGQRTTLTTALTAVAATNITPSVGDEYASITVIWNPYVPGTKALDSSSGNTGVATTSPAPRLGAARPLLADGSVTDDFNRSNGGLGANYTTSSGQSAPQIVSNKVSQTNGYVETRRTAETYGADQRLALDITAPASGAFGVAIMVRRTDPTTQYYSFGWGDASGGSYNFSKGDGVTDVPLASSITGVGVGATRRLELRAIGSTISGWVDGVQQFSVTDTTYPSGGAPVFGLYAAAGVTVTADNLAAVGTGAGAAAGVATTTGALTVPTPGGVTFTDDFNRADGGLGTPWVTVDGSGLTIASGKVVTTSAMDSARYDQPISADQWAEADVVLVFGGGGNSMGPAVRMGTTSNGDLYFTNYNAGNGALNVYRRLAFGNYAEVIAPIANSSTAFKLRLEAEANSIRLYKDGILIGSASNSDIASGQAGLFAQSFSGAIPSADNFAMGELDVTSRDVTDDFNRANGGIGANYSTISGATEPPIVSNQVSASGYVNTVRTAETYGNDQTAAIDVTGGGSADWIAWVYARTTTATGAQWYAMRWQEDAGGTYTLARGNPAGGEVVLGSTTGVGTTGTRRLEVRAIGSTISGWVDGVQLYTVTDTQFPSGSPGFGAFIATGSLVLDNFAADGVVAPPDVTDDFNRASGDIGSNYTTPTGSAQSPKIVANQVVCDTAVYGFVDTRRTAETYGADQIAAIDYTPVSGSDWAAWVSVRSTASGSQVYTMEWNEDSGGTYTLGRFGGGFDATLGTPITGVGATGTRRLEVRAIGSTISGWVDGVQRISVTDTTFPSGGNPGFGIFTNGVMAADNFAADGVVTAGGPVALAASSGVGVATATATAMVADQALGAATSDGVSTATATTLGSAKPLAGTSTGSAAGAPSAVLLEPFDNLSSWTTTAGTPSIVGTGRTGNALQIDTVSSVDYPIPDPAESATITVGFALYQTTNTATSDFFWLMSDNAATDHIRLRVNGDGSIWVLRGGGLFTTGAAGTIVLNAWQYVEVQLVLHDTAGALIMRVNGTPAISVSGVDTRNAGTKAVIDTVRLIGIGSGGVTKYDDLYIRTGADSFMGDIALPIAGGPSGTLTCAQELGSATSTGVSTTSGVLVLAEPLSGLATGAAITTATLVCDQALGAATADGVATTTGSLTTTGAPAVTMKVWNGTTFVTATIKVWNGTAYVDAAGVKTWSGSAWV